ncbi:MAG TPA: DUF72 domain-containing protein [Anaerolineales bacterium]|nr:DUF72 domain-containing protein [Anaerolineales bacterium]
MIRLGTSGFSYDDWVGAFYPPDLPRHEWLAYYAREFDTVELNVTYYRVPDRRTVEGWIHRTPDGFLFAVKAHRGLTHERREPDFEGFLDAIAPLRGAGRLACVLAQFPHSFAPSEDNWEYLRRLREGFGDHPLVVEFRQRSWVREGTFQRMAALGLGFCCVDEPQLAGLMPPEARATAPVGYVRFHGRNAQKWWEHDQAWERYDYSYQEGELKEWVPKLRRLEAAAEVVLVYANNHYRSQSVETLRVLRTLLGEPG